MASQHNAETPRRWAGGSKEGPAPKGTSIGGDDCLGLRVTVGKPKARPYRNLNKPAFIAPHSLQP